MQNVWRRCLYITRDRANCSGNSIRPSAGFITSRRYVRLRVRRYRGPGAYALTAYCSGRRRESSRSANSFSRSCSYHWRQLSFLRFAPVRNDKRHRELVLDFFDYPTIPPRHTSNYKAFAHYARRVRRIVSLAFVTGPCTNVRCSATNAPVVPIVNPLTVSKHARRPPHVRITYGICTLSRPCTVPLARNNNGRAICRPCHAGIL